MSAPVVPLPLDDARAIRDALLSLRDWSWRERVGPHGDAFYQCRWCGGTGPWPKEIRHRRVHTDGGPLPCRLERAATAIPALVTAIQDAEGRSGDSPVTGGRGV